MKTKNLIAMLLVTLGFVVMAYSGIAFSTLGTPFDFAGLHIQTTINHFIPPSVGILAFVIGMVLFCVDRKLA